MRILISLTLLVLIAGGVCLTEQRSSVMAQNGDEATRKLWDTAFIAPSNSRKPSKRRTSNYRIATPNVPVDNVAPDTVVGVTIWRLRPAKRSDSGERLIVHDDNATKEWLPERISENTKLEQGDKLRISDDAMRDGNLNVINRPPYT